MNHISLLTFLFFLSSSITFLLPTPTTSYCHPHDALALLRLKKSLGNPSGLASWANVTDDCCPLEYAFCDAQGTGRITSILLRDIAGLSGYITPSISLLSQLDTILIMENPGLVGTIPWSIGKLVNLTSLKIFINPRLSGPIPDSICDLQKLTDVDLSNNALTGPIPDCIGTKLHSNWIFFNRNQLSGPIPRSLGEYSSIPTIDLSHNRLIGDASFMFGEKKGQLESLDLSYNELEFDLSNVRFPLRLVGIYLNNNRIYGTIPSQISKLGRLVFFNASYNSLCGPVPTAGFMKNFDASAFSHNKCLCGGPLQPCHH